nr:hypothetical protein [Tanacetum cinerariifolium]
MENEHLDTIPEMESDEFIKSSVENLVLIPSESEDFSDIESECDMPDCDDSQTAIFSTFSNPLFNDSTSSDDESSHEEFAGELIFLESIPPGVDETNCDLEEDIHLVERLLYDNSSPRPPEEFVFENSDAAIESFSASPIAVEDSDSRMEEIDLTFTPDDPMPPSIEDDDNDSERDILILKELPSNYSLSLPEIESFCFDIPSFSVLLQNHLMFVQYSWKCEDSCQRISSSKSSFPQLQLGIILLHLARSQPMLKSSYKAEDGVIINQKGPINIPSSLRPPAKPPDDDEIEPNSGILTVKVVGDISEHYVLISNKLG